MGWLRMGPALVRGFPPGGLPLRPREPRVASGSTAPSALRRVRELTARLRVRQARYHQRRARTMRPARFTP